MTKLNFKIEVGKKYLTRVGKIVECIKIENRIVYLVNTTGVNEPPVWLDTGLEYSSVTSPNDIVDVFNTVDEPKSVDINISSAKSLKELNPPPGTIVHWIYNGNPTYFEYVVKAAPNRNGQDEIWAVFHRYTKVGSRNDYEVDANNNWISGNAHVKIVSKPIGPKNSHRLEDFGEIKTVRFIIMVSDDDYCASVTTENEVIETVKNFMEDGIPMASIRVYRVGEPLEINLSIGNFNDIPVEG